MAGTYRHGRTYCQVAGCHVRAMRAIEIDLPMAWEAAAEYTALTVVVGLCPRHGHDVTRRVRALLGARAELPQLLTIIDSAVQVEADLRERAEDLDEALAESEGLRGWECERAARAEAALRLLEDDLGQHRCPGMARHPSLQDLVPAARTAAGVDMVAAERPGGTAA